MMNNGNVSSNYWTLPGTSSSKTVAAILKQVKNKQAAEEVAKMQQQQLQVQSKQINQGAEQTRQSSSKLSQFIMDKDKQVGHRNSPLTSDIPPLCVRSSSPATLKGCSLSYDLSPSSVSTHLGKSMPDSISTTTNLLRSSLQDKMLDSLGGIPTSKTEDSMVTVVTFTHGSLPSYNLQSIKSPICTNYTSSSSNISNPYFQGHTFKTMLTPITGSACYLDQEDIYQTDSKSSTVENLLASTDGTIQTVNVSHIPNSMSDNGNNNASLTQSAVARSSQFNAMEIAQQIQMEASDQMSSAQLAALRPGMQQQLRSQIQSSHSIHAHHVPPATFPKGQSYRRTAKESATMPDAVMLLLAPKLTPSGVTKSIVSPASAQLRQRQQKTKESSAIIPSLSSTVSVASSLSLPSPAPSTSSVTFMSVSPSHCVSLAAATTTDSLMQQRQQLENNSRNQQQSIPEATADCLEPAISHNHSEINIQSDEQMWKDFQTAMMNQHEMHSGIYKPQTSERHLQLTGMSHGSTGKTVQAKMPVQAENHTWKTANHLHHKHIYQKGSTKSSLMPSFHSMMGEIEFTDSTTAAAATWNGGQKHGASSALMSHTSDTDLKNRTGESVSYNFHTDLKNGLGESMSKKFKSDALNGLGESSSYTPQTDKKNILGESVSYSYQTESKNRPEESTSYTFQTDSKNRWAESMSYNFQTDSKNRLGESRQTEIHLDLDNEQLVSVTKNGASVQNKSSTNDPTMVGKDYSLQSAVNNLTSSTSASALSGCTAKQRTTKSRNCKPFPPMKTSKSSPSIILQSLQATPSVSHTTKSVMHASSSPLSSSSLYAASTAHPSKQSLSQPEMLRHQYPSLLNQHQIFTTMTSQSERYMAENPFTFPTSTVNAHTDLEAPVTFPYPHINSDNIKEELYDQPNGEMPTLNMYQSGMQATNNGHGDDEQFSHCEDMSGVFHEMSDRKDIKDCENPIIEFNEEFQKPLVQPFNQRISNLSYFPVMNTTYRAAYRSHVVAVQRAKSGVTTDTSKSLDILRQNLQHCINKEIADTIKRYVDKYFQPALENIKKNNDQFIGVEQMNRVCLRILEEAKAVYVSDSGRRSATLTDNSDDLSETGSHGSRRRALKHRRLSDSDSEKGSDGSFKKKAVRKRGRPMFQGGGRITPVKTFKSGEPVRREGPKWDPVRLKPDTLFVMGARANKALGLGNTRGRLYIRHPDVFKYIGDQEDKLWLCEHSLMPATGGKAYMLLLEDIEDLSRSDEYKDSPGLMMHECVSFTVPEWMLVKMKEQMAALRSDSSKRGPSQSSNAEELSNPKDMPFLSFAESDVKTEIMTSPTDDEQINYMSTSDNNDTQTTSTILPFTLIPGFEDEVSQSSSDPECIEDTQPVANFLS